MICLDTRRGASGACGTSGSPRLTVIGLLASFVCMACHLFVKPAVRFAGGSGR
jgi:hypothetical protein